MRARFTQSFKIQAVEKALSRSGTTTLNDIANSLGMGCSTLGKWIVKARNQEFDSVSPDERSRMTQDKRPQDWTLEERLNMVVTCASMTNEKRSEHCREQGVYPHHVEQWRLDFVSGNTLKEKVVSPSEMKKLKQQNKTLKKELNRKDKALAETAALLVLQKKVHAIWGSDEDNLQ
jgi:transposase-like protein